MNKSCFAVPFAAISAALILLMASAARGETAVVTGAWVRALPPGQANTAAYMTITNPGAAALTLVGASASIARKVEIHTTGEVDGYMRMQQLEQLELPPGQALQLAPGGTHLMLLGLERMPLEGEAVRLCLQLAQAEQVCVSAEVRKTAGDQPPHKHHHH